MVGRNSDDHGRDDVEDDHKRIAQACCYRCDFKYNRNSEASQASRSIDADC